MLFGKDRAGSGDQPWHPANGALIDAMNKVHAIIWLDLDGTILDANQLFCNALGYRRDEIVGKNHRMFVMSEYANSPDYAQFWQTLRSGKFHQGEYLRRTKSGSDLWLQASYSPVFGDRGQIEKIVKLASDVTERRKTMDAVLAAFRNNAAGNVSVRVPPGATGALGNLVSAINADLTERAKLIRNITDLAGRIGHASSDLAQHAQTSFQAEAAQSEGLAQALEAVRSVETLVTETVAKLKSNRRMADATDSKSGEGHQVVREATEVMARIKEGSARIENIVGVIDSIAFQTNLLSLNASVEAARAGEAGRGFAVVAQEVRTLAQDTAREASEIRELVRQSVEDIGEGVTVVERVGTVLSNIKEGVGEIVAHTAEINQKCDAQVAGIARASDALSNLEDAGRHAIHRAQDSTSSVRELTQQAEALDQLVRSFGPARPATFERNTRMRAAG